MIAYTDKYNIKITSNTEPKTCIQSILPTDTKEEIKRKKQKPYKNKKEITFTILFENEEYKLFFPKDYCWDGATIPQCFHSIIGCKGCVQFLVPSMVHDKMCENHYLIKNNRKLSSLIFKELLVSCGSTRFKAQVMYLAVDGFQRVFGGWN